MAGVMVRLFGDPLWFGSVFWLAVDRVHSMGLVRPTICEQPMKPKKDGYGGKEKSSFLCVLTRRQKPGSRGAFGAVLPDSGLRADNRC